MIPLYFPDNKFEYIPAGFICLLFILGAFLTWKIFVRASKREQLKFEQMEKNLKEMNNAVPDTRAPK